MRRHLDELRKGAVEIRGHPAVLHGTEPGHPHTGAHQHPPVLERGIGAGAQFHHLAAAIRALNERKGRRLVPAAVGLLLRTAFLRFGKIFRPARNRRGVPAEPRVDLRVVDPRRQHLQQHLAGAGLGLRHLAVVQLVITAVAGGHHRPHGRCLIRQTETIRHVINAPASCYSIRSPSQGSAMTSSTVRVTLAVSVKLPSVAR